MRLSPDASESRLQPIFPCATLRPAVARSRRERRPKGNGTPDNPIVIASYGKGPKPVIDRQDDKQDRTGIRLADQGGFKIAGLEFARCMTGIYAEYSDNCPTRKFIRIENCVLNGKSKRPLGLPRCEIVNTTDWTEATWTK